MCANGRGNHKSWHGCRISPSYRWNLSRNGDSTLSDHFTLSRLKPAIGIYSSLGGGESITGQHGAVHR
jgi:hypothetical protein